VCIVVCDGLTGLPEAVASVWSETSVQGCVVHYVEDGIMWSGGGLACVGAGQITVAC
jgi:putative transposase